MKIVIFAGGTGKRFWPASRISNPKQFQNVQGDKPLVRLAYEQLLEGIAQEDIYFCTGKTYEKEIKSILPEVSSENFIFDPVMRDTGPAVTLAVAYLNKKFPEDVVVIRWADNLIKDNKTYIDALIEAENQVKLNNKFVFIAVPARFASPHRGYLKFGKELQVFNNPKNILKKFVRFVEKPSQEVAQEYLLSGEYAWNPGYWVIKPSAYLTKVAQTNKKIFNVCQEVVDSNFSEEAKNKYGQLEKISVDYVFAEKVFPDEALIIHSDMGWSDVGEWIALKEALEKNKDDVVTKGNVYPYQTKDSIIYNYEEGKMIATIGINGFVVVNTPDVIAIFPKEDNTKLKELLKNFEGTEYEKYL